MSKQLVRLLYAGLERDVGFDSQDFQRIRGAIEDIPGVRSCRELKSVGPSDLIHRLTFLAEVRARMEKAFKGPVGPPSACAMALLVIDEMGEEQSKKLRGDSEEKEELKCACGWEGTVLSDRLRHTTCPRCGVLVF